MHEKKVNNFTNISKVNNYLQPQTIDHKKYPTTYRVGNLVYYK